MAAKTTLVAGVGKRLASQIWSPAAAVAAGRTSPAAFFRIGVARLTSSSYDKEVEEQVRPAVVPDDVIGSGPGDRKYWGPHPKTGVFGPASDTAQDGGGPEVTSADAASSVLNQAVRFRPLEDVEKAPYA